MPRRDEDDAALHRAISSGDVDAVKALLARGADPSARGSDGLSALNHALALHRPEIVDVLLDHGAKLAAVRSDDPEDPFAAAWLVFTDVDRLRAVPLRPPGVVIGRDPGQCDVALRDFGISRRHARIDVHPDGRMTLTDLKSKGGSQVNRVPVVESPLAAGDRLRLGQVVFAVVA
jgi:Inner membrane component of T3SS, cytoplasmic domain/Ankyrin repeats (many copies)